MNQIHLVPNRSSGFESFILQLPYEKLFLDGFLYFSPFVLSS